MFIVFTFLNIAFPSVPIFEPYLKQGHYKFGLYEATLGMTVVLQAITCIFLTFALIKIKRLAEKEAGIKINIKQLILHLGSFYIYLVSFILWYASQLYF